MSRTLLAAVLLYFSTLASAQTVAGLGAITGSVRETSGAGIPNADVVVVNESKGINRHLTTNDVGLFSASSLVPAADYRVVITKAGFASYEAKEIGCWSVRTLRSTQFSMLPEPSCRSRSKPPRR